MLFEVRELISNLNFPLESNPDEWRGYSNTTCYNYVLGIKINTPLLIGDIIGKRVTHRNSISEILSRFKEEVSAIGFWAIECEVTDEVDDDCIKIFIEFDEDNNYHLLREDSDGTWSHKSVGILPNNTDYSGRVIIDPEAMGESLGDKFGICFMLYRE